MPRWPQCHTVVRLALLDRVRIIKNFVDDNSDLLLALDAAHGLIRHANEEEGKGSNPYMKISLFKEFNDKDATFHEVKKEDVEYDEAGENVTKAHGPSYLVIDSTGKLP